MIVKVLRNTKGKYLKDVFLEDFSDFFNPEPAIGVAGIWTTDNPEEAMTFRSSFKAIEMKSILQRDWDYANVEISKSTGRIY